MSSEHYSHLGMLFFLSFLRDLLWRISITTFWIIPRNYCVKTVGQAFQPVPPEPITNVIKSLTISEENCLIQNMDMSTAKVKMPCSNVIYVLQNDRLESLSYVWLSQQVIPVIVTWRDSAYSIVMTRSLFRYLNFTFIFHFITNIFPVSFFRMFLTNNIKMLL